MNPRDVAQIYESTLNSGDQSALDVPASTVKADLDFDAARDYSHMEALSTGTIRLLWTWYDAELGSCTCEPERLSTSTLRTLRVRRRTATVDLHAQLVASDHTVVLTGPVHLVRQGPGWLVRDYRRNGVDFAASIAARQGETSSQGLDVSVLGVDRDPTSEDFWFKITNGFSHAVALSSFTATAGGRTLRPDLYRPNVENIMAGRWMVTQVQWTTSRAIRAGTPTRIILRFVDQRTRAPISIALDSAS